MTSAAENQAPERIGHLINGERIVGDGRSLEVFNPALGRCIREVACASRSEVTRAVDAAEAAFPAWRATPAVKRARIMFRFKSLLEEHADEIAGLLSEEHGKVHSDALGEVQRGIENVEFACAAPELLKGEHMRDVAPGIDSWSEMQPLGVMVGITPFNFPAMVPLWMYPLALVCGNTFVLKPSERDPGSAMRVAELAREAGVPDGVLNVVNGDREAVDALLAEPRVRGVSFVGSTPVAEHIYATATANGKRVQALGGAKNHAVIMPDADIDNVANALMGAAYGSCGERCMAISVAVTVGDATADALVGRLTGSLENLRVGPGDQQGSDMGPLITREHRERVAGYVDLGVQEGAELVVDGRDHRVDGHDDGFFLGPCLFDRVTDAMRIYREEIFGPVLCVVRAENMEQALALVQGHEYGNGTCVFTRDGEAARYFADQVEVGMVGINVPLPVPVAYHSFGGWKRSLFGDLHAYGPDGVRFYTRRKTISQRWPTGGIRETANYNFPSNG